MAEKEFVDTVIKVKRVTKVTKGGKRFSFAAFVVSGDQAGHVGIGLGKSKEVSSAISKATTTARKNMIPVALRGDTIPYDVMGTHGSASVLIRSAKEGKGVIAGRAVRAVMVALGVKNVVAKSVGKSRSGQNLVKATLHALAKCRTVDSLAKLRGKSITQLIKGSHVNA